MASTSLATASTNGSPTDLESIVETIRSELARPHGERPSHFVRLERRLETATEQLRSALADPANHRPSEVVRRLEFLYEAAELGVS